MRNNYFKLNHPFQKTSIGQNGLSYIRPAIWKRIPEILKKTKNTLNTIKDKVKQYYLNDLFHPNLRNVSGFDYALSVQMILFLFIKFFFIKYFFLALLLKGHNQNMAIRLFSVIFALLFFISLIFLVKSVFSVYF